MVRRGAHRPQRTGEGPPARRTHVAHVCRAEEPAGAQEASGREEAGVKAGPEVRLGPRGQGRLRLHGCYEADLRKILLPELDGAGTGAIYILFYLYRVFISQIFKLLGLDACDWPVSGQRCAEEDALRCVSPLPRPPRILSQQRARGPSEPGGGESGWCGSGALRGAKQPKSSSASSCPECPRP